MHRLLVMLFVLCLVPALFAQAVGGAVQTSTVTLSSAQLQHMAASPAQLAAAPGTGKLLNLVSVVAQYRSGGSAYALPGGGQFTLSLGQVPIHITLIAAGFIDQTSNQIQMNEGCHGGTQSGMENQPLMISNDGDSEWTGGDGTVIVTVYYTVVDLQ